MDVDKDRTGGGDDATVTVGPTSGGIMRIPVEEGGCRIATDFDLEAAETADGSRTAAEQARAPGGRDAAASQRHADSGQRR